MFHVICYDIVDDRLRQKLHDRLLGYGTRIQDSVFEAILDDPLYQRLAAEIGRLPLGDEDRIRIYRMCRRCVDMVLIHGKGEVTADEEYFVI